MAFTEEEKQNIVNFFTAVDEMIEGRFLLSDTKVSNILKSVVKSEVLYNLYSKCVTGFKFAQSLENASATNSNNSGRFVLPDGEKDIVAFVTCLLLEVDKKNINLQAFVSENFFSPDGYNISYSNFAITVLVEYKRAVCDLLGIDENCNITEGDFGEYSVRAEEKKVEADQNTKILFANLEMTINELSTMIAEDYKMKYNEKEELLIVLKALNRSVKIQELLIINALLVPLEHAMSKNKKYRETYENLKLTIADIYY